MKVVFHQLSGWLNANIMLLRHVQSLITVLFIWLDLKVNGSLIAKLRAKYRPSALLILELGTFPFIANVPSYQLFVQTLIKVWYSKKKKINLELDFDKLNVLKSLPRNYENLLHCNYYSYVTIFLKLLCKQFLFLSNGF